MSSAILSNRSAAVSKSCVLSGLLQVNSHHATRYQQLPWPSVSYMSPVIVTAMLLRH